MKHKIALLVLAVAVLAAQPAFAKTAPAVASAPGHAEWFETGKSTLQEVEKALGEPNSTTAAGSGKTACYRYAVSPTVPPSFLRIDGSGSHDADLTCCYSFGGDGHLKGIKASGSGKEQASCPPLLRKPADVVHLLIIEHR